MFPERNQCAQGDCVTSIQHKKIEWVPTPAGLLGIVVGVTSRERLRLCDQVGEQGLMAGMGLMLRSENPNEVNCHAMSALVKQLEERMLRIGTDITPENWAGGPV